MNPKYYAALRNYCTRYGIDWRFDTIQNPITLIWQVLKVVNELVGDMDELQKAMEDLIQTITGTIDDKVVEVLQGWLNDGTLEEIIDENILMNKLDKTHALSTDVQVVLNIFNEENPNIQGFTKIDNGNYIIATLNSTQSQCTLIEYLADGTLYRTANVNTDHSNSLSYYNGKIYVAHLYSFIDGQRVDNNKISIIDYSSLTVQSTFSVDMIARGISVYGGRVYILGNSNSFIGVYDISFNKITEIQLEGGYVDGLQSLQVTSNHIMVLGATSLAVYSLSGKLERIYNLPKFDNYKTAELQDISFINSELYVSNLFLPNSLSNKAIYLIGKLDTETSVKVNNVINQNPNPAGQKIVYVNKDYVKADNNGSESKPFTSIEQALLIDESVTIHVYGGNYGDVQIARQYKPLYILGRDNNVIFNSLLINDSTNIVIERVKVLTGYNAERTYGVTARYVDGLKLINVTLPLTQGMQLFNSSCSIANMTEENMINADIDVGQNSLLQTNYQHEKLTKGSSGFVTSGVIEAKGNYKLNDIISTRNAITGYKNIKVIINHRNEDREYFIPAKIGVHRINLLQMSLSNNEFMQGDLIFTNQLNKVTLTGETWIDIKQGVLAANPPSVTIKSIIGV